MKKFWILLSIYSLLPLCLPVLKPPEEYLALNYLSQILSKRQDAPVPDIRISLILEGREYFPGETIDLGMGDPFKLITRNFILKNSGKFAISLDSNGPPSITSNSLGSLSLKSDSSIPENWPPGDEFRITLNAFPGSDSENTWNVRLSIVSPEEIIQEFSFRILSTPIKTGRLFYSILNPLADRGIVSRTFDSETETWGAEFIHINNPSSYVFAPTEYGRFIYYNRETPAEVHGNYIDSDGILQSVPINSNVTLNVSFTNGSFIPIQNRLLTQGGSGNLITTTYNNTTGVLDTPMGPFGTQCVSRFIRSTPNGDFVIQPHGNVIGFPGRFQIGKVETDGSLTNVYNSPIYYEDPDPSNRLSVWWKHFINDYIYFVSHTGTPGINNLKVDSILRRTLNSEGTLSTINQEYSIGISGASYSQIVQHPNDKWVYILGYDNTNVPIIHFYLMDLESGYPEKVETYNFPSFIPAPLGSLSPDGKYLALRLRINGSICPTCEQSIKVFRIEIDGRLSEILSESFNREISDINWLAKP